MNVNQSNSIDDNSRDSASRRIDELKRKRDIFQLNEKEARELSDLEWLLKRENIKKEEEERKSLEKRLYDARLEQIKEEGKVREQLQEKINKKVEDLKENSDKYLADATKNIVNALDKRIDAYVSNMQSLNAHLQGSNNSLSNLIDKLNDTLSSTSLVSQQKVFENLANYVKSGITYNVEQRAFLRTISDDIDLTFDKWTDSMNQLVRIQQTDSSANRLALEYTLQNFLTENYKTSEYIVDAFSSVSNSLLTSQSTMSASNAMQFEAVVQSWLGSMYSAGMNSNTITSLASALDQLGSGDISKLGSGISNLVLMGAARAGLDYGALLNNGLSADTANVLLANIAGYLQEMGANQSNVVRSQLGNLFGVNITDLIAAGNLRNTQGSRSSISTDIESTLLADYAGFTPFAARFNNILDNFMFSWGTNIADNPVWYTSYQAEKMLSGVLGTILDDISISVGGKNSKLPAGISVDLGTIARAMPLITLLPTLLQTVVGDVIPSISNGAGGLSGIFSALGESAAGATIKMSDIGVSGSAYIGNASSTGGLLDNAMSSINDLLSQTTTIESEDEGPTLDENVVTITDTVVKILDLLNDKFDKSISEITNESTSTGWSSVTNFNI